MDKTGRSRWPKRIAAGASAAVLACIWMPAGSVLASETTQTQENYSQVASEEEKVTPQEVGLPGMVPVTGEQIQDGVYEVTVESSSSMFRIEKAELTVNDGEMQAVLTLGGTGYLKLYMGTGEEASAADPADYIDYVEDADGKYTYLVPVTALDEPLDCAAFSKKKEKWYDRQILFEAASLPGEAVLTELPDYEALEKAAREERIMKMKEENTEEVQPEPSVPAALDLSDGTYVIPVSLEGGSGRASVTSPTQLFVADGLAEALVEWSSSNYDYMLVKGEKYLPLDGYEHSAFLIPVENLEQPLEVVADTTAMSTPHEISYTLTFDSSSLAPQKEKTDNSGSVVLLVLAVCVCAAGALKGRRR